MEPPSELPLTGHLGQGEPSPGRRSLPPELLRPSWSSPSWASSGHLGTTASDAWDALCGPGGGSLENSLWPCPMLASSLSLPVEGLVPPSFHKRSQRQPLQGLRAPSPLPHPPCPGLCPRAWWPPLFCVSEQTVFIPLELVHCRTDSILCPQWEPTEDPSRGAGGHEWFTNAPSTCRGPALPQVPTHTYSSSLRPPCEGGVHHTHMTDE